MPCFTNWNENLQPGTREYEEAEGVVRAKLESIRHIIDYYYSVNEHSKPDLPDGTRIDPLRQPKSRREQQIRNLICHHFVCDGMTAATLYDASSVLNEHQREDRPYLAIILPCATLLRLQPLDKAI